VREKPTIPKKDTERIKWIRKLLDKASAPWIRFLREEKRPRSSVVSPRSPTRPGTSADGAGGTVRAGAGPISKNGPTTFDPTTFDPTPFEEGRHQLRLDVLRAPDERLGVDAGLLLRLERQTPRAVPHLRTKPAVRLHARMLAHRVVASALAQPEVLNLQLISKWEGRATWTQPSGTASGCVRCVAMTSVSPDRSECVCRSRSHAMPAGARGSSAPARWCAQAVGDPPRVDSTAHHGTQRCAQRSGRTKIRAGRPPA
jgi:hypothetical protein